MYLQIIKELGFLLDVVIVNFKNGFIAACSTL